VYLVTSFEKFNQALSKNHNDTFQQDIQKAKTPIRWYVPTASKKAKYRKEKAKQFF